MRYPAAAASPGKSGAFGCDGCDGCNWNAFHGDHGNKANQFVDLGLPGRLVGGGIEHVEQQREGLLAVQLQRRGVHNQCNQCVPSPLQKRDWPNPTICNTKCEK